MRAVGAEVLSFDRRESEMPDGCGVVFAVQPPDPLLGRPGPRALRGRPGAIPVLTRGRTPPPPHLSSLGAHDLDEDAGAHDNNTSGGFAAGGTNEDLFSFAGEGSSELGPVNSGLRKPVFVFDHSALASARVLGTYCATTQGISCKLLSSLSLPYKL